MCIIWNDYAIIYVDLNDYRQLQVFNHDVTYCSPGRAVSLYNSQAAVDSFKHWLGYDKSQKCQLPLVTEIAEEKLTPL